MANGTKRTMTAQRAAELEAACLAHESHDDPGQHAGECGFCNQIVSDAEHRAYLDATPTAHEHHHGAA
jgi:hypothetical protein